MSATILPAFFAGSPGPMELIVIFMLILVLFGPRRLPEIAKMIGKTIHELRKASEDFKEQVMSIEVDPVETDLTDTDDLDDMNDPEDPYDYDEYHDPMAKDVIEIPEDDVAEEDSKEESA